MRQKAEQIHTEPFILKVDLPRDPIQRRLARTIRADVDGVRGETLDAARERADGDEARERAGFEQRVDGLEEDDGAADVDL